MTLTKKDLFTRIHNQLDFNKKDSQDLVESVLSIMKHTLATGEELKVSGFGKFEVKQKKDRNGRNPANGETITIEARKILTFKPSVMLKHAINR